MSDYEDRREEPEEVVKPIHEFNLDTLQPQKHIWVDRGLKYTCENAGHASHEAWKRRASTVNT